MKNENEDSLERNGEDDGGYEKTGLGRRIAVTLPLLAYWIYPPEVKEGAEVQSAQCHGHDPGAARGGLDGSRDQHAYARARVVPPARIMGILTPYASGPSPVYTAAAICRPRTTGVSARLSESSFSLRSWQ